MKHVLVAYVEDKPGVLNRVVSLFRQRAFNIDSLTVGRTETDCVSRMTIVVDTDDTGVARVEANLYKLVNVLRVDDVTHRKPVLRDLAPRQGRDQYAPIARSCSSSARRTKASSSISRRKAS